MDHFTNIPKSKIFLWKISKTKMDFKKIYNHEKLKIIYTIYKIKTIINIQCPKRKKQNCKYKNQKSHNKIDVNYASMKNDGFRFSPLFLFHFYDIF